MPFEIKSNPVDFTLKDPLSKEEIRVQASAFAHSATITLRAPMCRAMPGEAVTVFIDKHKAYELAQALLRFYSNN